MKFYVEFECKEGEEFPLYIPDHFGGTFLIELLASRGEDPEGFSSYVEGAYSPSVEVEVPKEVAERSGRFFDLGRCKVIVPPRFLNMYTKVSPMETPVEKRFEVLLDHKKVIEEWERSGFPKEWGTEN